MSDSSDPAARTMTMAASVDFAPRWHRALTMWIAAETDLCR
jgi:hypothetical protein